MLFRSGGSSDPCFLPLIFVRPLAFIPLVLSRGISCYILSFSMSSHRRVARLARENYFGRQTYFITICCDRRVSYLSVPATAQRVLDLLLECAASHSFRLHAFCLLPDHLHLLAEGAEPHCDLLEFVRLLKQRTAFDFRKSRSRPLWEKSFYDHVLRSADSIEDVACYIWWNPVRKRLCTDPREFPYSGSQTIDWIKRAASGTSWSAPWKTPEPV